MKTLTKDVKLKGQVVDTIEIEQVDTIEEAIELHGEESCVALINRMYLADRMNKKRGEHRESEPGKQRKTREAYNALAVVTFDDGKTGLEKLQKVSTLATEAERAAGLEKLLNSPEVVAEVEKRLGING